MTVVEPTTDTTTSNRPRREVLCGLVVGLLAPAALAACGESSPSGGGSTPTGGGSTPTGGGSTPTGGGGGGGGAQVLAAVADVPEGSGLVVNKPSGSGKLVLVRPSGNEVKAFDAMCKHQGVIVAAPKDGTITCPAHGSQYDAATGALKKGPATSGLDEVPVKVDGTNVVMA